MKTPFFLFVLVTFSSLSFAGGSCKVTMVSVSGGAFGTLRADVLKNGIQAWYLSHQRELQPTTWYDASQVSDATVASIKLDLAKKLNLRDDVTRDIRVGVEQDGTIYLENPTDGSRYRFEPGN